MTRAVAYFGTYEPDYPRNAVLIAGLREHGVEVFEFQAALPQMTAAEMAGARGAARLAAGIAAAHVRLLAQHRGRLDVDAVVVGYPGHFLVPFGRLLAAFRHARLVFDPLVSLLDTFAGDRGLVRSGGGKAAAVRVVDEIAFRLPRLVLADTWAHAAYYQEAFGLARDRLAVVPVGALPEPRADGAARTPAQGEPLTVLQYGKWSPLHGAGVVLAAAELLRRRAVPLRADRRGAALGRAAGRHRGPPASPTSSGSASCRPRSCARTHWPPTCVSACSAAPRRPRASCPTRSSTGWPADGPSSPPTATAPASGLRDGETALLTPAGDAAALAAALRRLLDERERVRLGEAALALYRRAFTPAAVAGELLEALERDVTAVGGRQTGPGPEGAPPVAAPEDVTVGASSRRRRVVLRLVQVVIVAATVYFLAAYLIRSWGSIEEFDWTFDVGWLAALRCGVSALLLRAGVVLVAAPARLRRHESVLAGRVGVGQVDPRALRAR